VYYKHVQNISFNLQCFTTSWSYLSWNKRKIY